MKQAAELHILTPVLICLHLTQSSLRREQCMNESIRQQILLAVEGSHCRLRHHPEGQIRPRFPLDLSLWKDPMAEDDTIHQIGSSTT